MIRRITAAAVVAVTVAAASGTTAQASHPVRCHAVRLVSGVLVHVCPPLHGTPAHSPRGGA